MEFENGEFSVVFTDSLERRERDSGDEIEAKENSHQTVRRSFGLVDQIGIEDLEERRSSLSWVYE